MSNALERVAPTPMDLIQMAIEKEGSIDVIERLAKLQMEFQDRDDKVAFSQAMARFKDEMPRIIRTRSIKDKDGAEKYKAVALEDVADPLIKALLRFGITYRFVTDMLPNGHVKVTCFLRLQGTAYEEQGSTLAAPPDTSGGKDALKAVGSTASYLEKYTLLASCGVHVYGSDPEAVPTKDKPEPMDEKTFAHHMEKIQAARSEAELKAAYFAAADAAQKAGDRNALLSFEKAKKEAWRQNGGYR